MSNTNAHTDRQTYTAHEAGCLRVEPAQHTVARSQKRRRSNFCEPSGVLGQQARDRALRELGEILPILIEGH